MTVLILGDCGFVVGCTKELAPIVSLLCTHYLVLDLGCCPECSTISAYPSRRGGIECGVKFYILWDVDNQCDFNLLPSQIQTILGGHLSTLSNQNYKM